MKDIKIFLKKKKKNEEYGCERYKIIQKMKNKSLLSIEKKQNEKNYFIIILRKYFNLENFASF